MLKTDPTNVFVYIKLVFEKMRNKKIEPKSGDGKKSSVEEDNTSDQGKNPEVEQEESMKAKDQPEVEPNNEASSSQSNPIPTERIPSRKK